MARKKRLTPFEAARAYYSFQNLPINEQMCAGEKSVPQEPPDDYYLSIGGSDQEESVNHWLQRRRWSQRLVVIQLGLLAAAAVGFGAIFDLSTCTGSEEYETCPAWKQAGFYTSVVIFILCFGGSIVAACNVRLAQSKLDQVHTEYAEQQSFSSENSVSVSSSRKSPQHSASGQETPSTGLLA